MKKRAQTTRESPPSRETFPKRTRRPGEVGLANELRPGLGTRRKAAPSKTSGVKRKTKTDREPLGRVAPLPPSKPREEPADTFAHELEHDTGVSGHLGAD